MYEQSNSRDLMVAQLKMVVWNGFIRIDLTIELGYYVKLIIYTFD